MASSTTPTTKLRRRMRILENTTPLSPLLSVKADSTPLHLSKFKAKHSPESCSSAEFEAVEAHSSTSSDGGESGSEDDDEFNQGDMEQDDASPVDVVREDSQTPKPPAPASPRRPTISTKDLKPVFLSKERTPMSPNSRAWYEFDLAVVVALVSPIGNWLTGGDHVKNLLLVVLLVFYLHQVIEVPWVLYQKARPRHRPPRGSPLSSDPTEARYAQLAASELQKYELFFLCLTVASPVLGALLLRYVTAIILGPQAVSWFNTGLFVLATGMRPWAHIVERFHQRTEELNDFIHYPSLSLRTSQEQFQEFEKRIAKLEQLQLKSNSKVRHMTDDVYGYVDNAIDAVEHAIRKQEKKWERYESKVKDIEDSIISLQSSQKTLSDVAREHHGHGRGGIKDVILSDVQSAMGLTKSVVGFFIPTRFVPDFLSSYLGKPPAYSSPKKDLYHGLYANSTAASSIGLSKLNSNRRRTFSPLTSPLQCSTPLETIHEGEGGGERSPLWELVQYPWLARPSGIMSSIVYKAGYVLTMPLRAVLRMVLGNY